MSLRYCLATSACSSSSSCCSIQTECLPPASGYPSFSSFLCASSRLALYDYTCSLFKIYLLLQSDSGFHLFVLVRLWNSLPFRHRIHDNSTISFSRQALRLIIYCSDRKTLRVIVTSENQQAGWRRVQSQNLSKTQGFSHLCS